MFTDLFPGLGRVTALTTHLENGLVTRYYFDDSGLLVATGGSATSAAVTDAIEAAIDA